MMSTIFVGEARRACNSLRRAPLFACSVVSILAVTIGGMTALGTAARELLFASLPYGDSERLVLVWSDLPKSGYSRAPLSGPELKDLRERANTLEDVAAMFPGMSTLTEGDDPRQIRVTNVTGNIFAVLRSEPLLGRTFSPADEGQGKAPTILLSWALWQSRYGGDGSIVGRRIQVDGRATEVIGVMPRTFHMAFPPDANIPADTEAWKPFLTDVSRSPRQRFFIRLVARLRPGVSFDQAAEQVTKLGGELESQFTEYAPSGRRIFLAGLQRDLRAPVQWSALAMGGGAGFLVLLAFVNIAGLFVARSSAQNRERAIQMALGASTSRLWLQLVTQAMILSFGGAALGTAIGALGLRILQRIRPASLGRLDHALLAPDVIVGIAAVAVVSTLLVALLIRASVNVSTDSVATRVKGTAPLQYRLRSALVVAQIAVSFALLVGAALWVSSFVNLLRTDPGFRPEQALTFRYSVGPLGLRTPDEFSGFNRRVTEAVAGLPGVISAGSISHLPYDPLPNWSMSYRPVEAPTGTEREADSRPVSPGFLTAAGARLLAGRFFEESDDLRAQRVIVVDRLLAERAWPGQDAIGRQISVETAAGAPRTTWTIIGVIEHLRHRSIEAVVREQVYLPVRQFVSGPFAVIARTSGDLSPLAAAIRSRLKELEPRLPVWGIRPLHDYYADAAAERRFAAYLLGGFGLSALALASIGMYGVIAFIVRSRQPEFGLRIALGAEGRRVAGSVLSEGLRFALFGITAGAAIGAVSATAMSNALYGVRPFDGTSWASAVAITVCVTAVACWGPAIRASRTDPASLMRAE